MNTFSNTNTDDVQNHLASAPWPDSPWTMGDHSYAPVPQSTHPKLISSPGYLSASGQYVPDFNATDYAAFTLAPTTEMGIFTNLPVTQVDYAYQNAPDPWTPAPSLFDAAPAVSQLPPVGDPDWPGVAHLPAYSAAATPDLGVSPASSTPTFQSQDEWAWNLELLESSCGILASSSGHGGEAGWVAPEPGVILPHATTSQIGRDTSGFSQLTPVAPDHVVSNFTATFAPTVALGKRHHEAEEPQGDGGLVGIGTHELPPQKRARGGTTKGNLKAAGSAARTHPEPVARIPRQRTDNRPKAAGRGAERLATPSAQGIYYQPSPRPSFQRGWVVDAADGKPTWDEGSVGEEVAHHVDNAVEQNQEELTEKTFEIPRKLEPGHRLLLQASDTDFARGAVQAIKCRVCPKTKLKNFDQFKRHCDFTETHPLVIHFCDKCGDYFARPDSLVRHERKCDGVTPDEAAKKRRETEEAHGEFIRNLEHSLKTVTGQVVVKPFSRIIKDKFPKSSKKRKGSGDEQSRH